MLISNYLGLSMKVKYEMIGRGKASRYFEVNHETGAISIKDDLRKEMDTEYLVGFS